MNREAKAPSTGESDPGAPPILLGFAPVDPYGGALPDLAAIADACRQEHVAAEPEPASITAKRGEAARVLEAAYETEAVHRGAIPTPASGRPHLPARAPFTKERQTGKKK